MFCVYTEVMAQDDTVIFEQNHALFSAFNLRLTLTSPNNAFMRCRLYSKRKVKFNKVILKMLLLFLVGVVME